MVSGSSPGSRLLKYIMDMDGAVPEPRYARQANWLQLGVIASQLIRGDPCWNDGRWLVIRWESDVVHPPREDNDWSATLSQNRPPLDRCVMYQLLVDQSANWNQYSPWEETAGVLAGVGQGRDGSVTYEDPINGPKSVTMGKLMDLLGLKP